MNPAEICDLQIGDGPWERVRVMVRFGEGRGEVFAVFLRLRDNKRLIMYRGGRIVEAVA